MARWIDTARPTYILGRWLVATHNGERFLTISDTWTRFHNDRNVMPFPSEESAKSCIERMRNRDGQTQRRP